MRNWVRIMRALSGSNRIKTMKSLQRRVVYVCQMPKAAGLVRYTAGKPPKIVGKAGPMALCGGRPWATCRRAGGDRNPSVAGLYENLRYRTEKDLRVGVRVARPPAIRGEMMR